MKKSKGILKQLLWVSAMVAIGIYGRYCSEYEKVALTMLLFNLYLIKCMTDIENNIKKRIDFVSEALEKCQNILKDINEDNKSIKWDMERCVEGLKKMEQKNNF